MYLRRPGGHINPPGLHQRTNGRQISQRTKRTRNQWENSGRDPPKTVQNRAQFHQPRTAKEKEKSRAYDASSWLYKPRLSKSLHNIPVLQHPLFKLFCPVGLFIPGATAISLVVLVSAIAVTLLVLLVLLLPPPLSVVLVIFPGYVACVLLDLIIGARVVHVDGTADCMCVCRIEQRWHHSRTQQETYIDPEQTFSWSQDRSKTPISFD